MAIKKFMLTACFGVLSIGGAAIYQVKQKAEPLRGHDITFPSAAMSASDLQSFLADDFTIVTDVKALPPPVLAAYTETAGTRPLMANPGQEFIVGDVIYDASVPRMRLIFAGISGNKCFVHYERGGFAHSYLLALFKLGPNEFKPIWRGYCGASKNLADLRSKVANGLCQLKIG